MTEFERIARFTRAFGVKPAPRGPGDDCAVLEGGLCVTTDALVEDVHFTRPAFSFEDVGHKALAVNLSDLAAMGARPTWFLCAVAMPKGMPERALDGIARGMRALARRHRIELVGGNFTRARELSITITAAGVAKRPMLRSGARVGDVVYVSGTLGDAAASLSRGNEEPSPRPSPEGRGDPSATAALKALDQRQRRPEPRIELGLIAARYASASIDLSDGLAQDLAHLCSASGVGARIHVGELPLSAALVRAFGPRATQLALRGGEDYELLLCVPRAKARAFERAAAGHRVTQIGHIEAGRRPTFLGARGRPERVPRGFDHFR